MPFRFIIYITRPSHCSFSKFHIFSLHGQSLKFFDFFFDDFQHLSDWPYCQVLFFLFLLILKIFEILDFLVFKNFGFFLLLSRVSDYWSVLIFWTFLSFFGIFLEVDRILEFLF